MTSYPEWFDETHRFAPHAWQGRLGEASCCENRLIRVPAGRRKTFGYFYAKLIKAFRWGCRITPEHDLKGCLRVGHCSKRHGLPTDTGL